MNIIEAFKKLKDGYHIRRRAWENDKFYLYKSIINENMIMCKEDDYMKEKFGSELSDNFEIDDILVDDWEIYEAK